MSTGVDVDNLEIKDGLGLSPEAAGEYARRISILLQYGRFDNAIRLILEADVQSVEECPLAKLTPLSELPLGNSELPLRVINMLEKKGITTWGAVSKCSPKWLVDNIPGFGVTSIKQLQDALKREIAKRQSNLAK